MPTRTGWPFSLRFDDILDDGFVLGLLGLVDQVVFVVADHILVRRDGDDFHLVGVHELVGLGRRRTRHAGELVVHPEEVLDGDCGDGLVLFLDLDAFFGLDGLMEPFGVAPALEHTPRELVDDVYLSIGDDVLIIFVEERLRPQRLVEVVDEVGVDVVVEVLYAESILDLLDTALGRSYLLLFLVHLVVLAAFQARNYGGETVVDVGCGLWHTRDYERGARFVDQDGVDLVHNPEVQLALHELVGRGRYIVSQVVEAELRVRAVGYVGVVGDLALFEVHRLLDEADLEAKEIVDPTHPGRVATGKVVVDGDDVDALAFEGIQIHGHGRGERLALARLHLSDLPFVQDDAAHDLHVEGAHSECTLRDFPHHGEGLGQQLVEGLPSCEPLAKLLGLLPQL